MDASVSWVADSLDLLPSNLPPLPNLPNWSRVGILDRARYPRLLSSDCVSSSLQFDNQALISQKRTGTDMRIASLEKDILFLQQQHKDVLEKLHEEIEDLKRKNKELQYRLIMDSGESPQKEAQTASPSSSGRNFPQSSRSHILNGPPSQNGHTGRSRETSGLHRTEPSTSHTHKTIASLHPLRIHSGASQSLRAPTLQECEKMIQNLYTTNSLQSQELLRLKAILKDIVFNKKKISCEVSNLTKAYLSEPSRGDDLEQFPKQPLKPLPNKLPSVQPRLSDKVVLPAIKQSLSTTMTERQKKAQDMHKSRLRREVNHQPCCPF